MKIERSSQKNVMTLVKKQRWFYYISNRIVIIIENYLYQRNIFFIPQRKFSYRDLEKLKANKKVHTRTPKNQLTVSKVKTIL